MPMWNTSVHPVQDQFDYWREVICQAFVPLAPGRKDQRPGFASDVETRPLADVNRAKIVSRAQSTHHGPGEVARTSEPYYFVNLQLRGQCRTEQGPTTSIVQPGQFVLLDTAEPFYLEFEQDWEMLSFRIPHRRLDARLAGYRPRVGEALGTHGAGRIAGSLVQLLWDAETMHGGIAEHEIEESLLAATAAAVAGTPPDPDELGRDTLQAALQRHIREHLTDPGLSVHSVCRAFAFSPRTLHNLFADTGRSFAATVRDLRLDRAAQLLSDGAYQPGISHLGMSLGFGDPSSFGRAFRRRFGCSPRDYRRAAGERARIVG
ncbi:helix-turn-helix domain-containing protein [Arthrobacter sp.]|uniref:helix-turn-helix domain-containing protein n=1 Tax=Arthrobacter sp. TaxID=1667 RepID=UPI003A8E8FAF